MTVPGSDMSDIQAWFQSRGCFIFGFVVSSSRHTAELGSAAIEDLGNHLPLPPMAPQGGGDRRQHLRPRLPRRGGPPAHAPHPGPWPGGFSRPIIQNSPKSKNAWCHPCGWGRARKTGVPPSRIGRDRAARVQSLGAELAGGGALGVALAPPPATRCRAAVKRGLVCGTGEIADRRTRITSGLGGGRSALPLMNRKLAAIGAGFAFRFATS